MAPAVSDGRQQLDRGDPLPLARRRQLHPDGIGREGFLDRWRVNTSTLVRLREVHLQADRVLEKLTAAVQQRIMHRSSFPGG